MQCIRELNLRWRILIAIMCFLQKKFWLIYVWTFCPMCLVNVFVKF